MNLTLRGFLRSYCRELTGLETDSLRKLLASALCESPAAAEAVMAFAASKRKQPLFRLFVVISARREP